MITPERVLDIFKEITTVPRESGHEGPMTEYLLGWAESHGLYTMRDAIGNVLIVKEAAPGKENVPSIALQCHQDMVCESRAGVTHDFSRDPIRYVIENGWMVAPDTTLGADDGIGIAACLALLESDTPTGKLECVFTISEETGMDGANFMQEGFFTSKILINLDSEDEGQLFIGCAGGLNTIATFRAKRQEAPAGHTCLKLQIEGGMGGHSGDDINKERMNAVQQMSRFLWGELGGISIVSIDGGNKSNAIARDCNAVVYTSDAAALKERFGSFVASLQAEFHVTDPGVCGSAAVVEGSGECLQPVLSRKLVNALFTCPHGVSSMSQDIAGLVETSTNLASVRTLDSGIRVVTSQRSSVESAKKMIADKVFAVFKAAGARVEHIHEYPGWTPDVSSRILAVCVESYRRLFGQEPEVKAIHAGLECGLFLKKFPGLDMISFGPTLRSVHAPGERLELTTFHKFTELLEDVLTTIS